MCALRCAAQDHSPVTESRRRGLILGLGGAAHQDGILWVNWDPYCYLGLWPFSGDQFPAYEIMIDFGPWIAIAEHWPPGPFNANAVDEVIGIIPPARRDPREFKFPRRPVLSELGAGCPKLDWRVS